MHSVQVGFSWLLKISGFTCQRFVEQDWWLPYGLLRLFIVCDAMMCDVWYTTIYVYTVKQIVSSRRLNLRVETYLALEKIRGQLKIKAGRRGARSRSFYSSFLFFSFFSQNYHKTWYLLSSAPSALLSSYSSYRVETKLQKKNSSYLRLYLIMNSNTTVKTWLLN